MTDLWADVKDFHTKFELRPRMAVPTPLLRLPHGAGTERLRHLREELEELAFAAASFDVAAEADALADLVYVAVGTALMQGVPFDKVWALVHAANMKKVRAATAKQVAKPDGWRDPVGDIRAVLGYYDALGEGA